MMVLRGDYDYELPHPFLQLFIQLADDDIYVSLRLLFTLLYPLSMAKPYTVSITVQNCRKRDLKVV
jgi:hypothetical protein